MCGHCDEAPRTHDELCDACHELYGIVDESEEEPELEPRYHKTKRRPKCPKCNHPLRKGKLCKHCAKIKGVSFYKGRPKRSCQSTNAAKADLNASDLIVPALADDPARRKEIGVFWDDQKDVSVVRKGEGAEENWLFGNRVDYLKAWRTVMRAQYIPENRICKCCGKYKEAWEVDEKTFKKPFAACKACARKIKKALYECPHCHCKEFGWANLPGFFGCLLCWGKQNAHSDERGLHSKDSTACGHERTVSPTDVSM
jgi:predicted nucleic acid-binding Zn ribbon protein